MARAGWRSSTRRSSATYGAPRPGSTGTGRCRYIVLILPSRLLLPLPHPLRYSACMAKTICLTISGCCVTDMMTTIMITKRLPVGVLGRA